MTNKTYTPEEWFNLSRDLHDLISSEIEQATEEILPEVYPKLVIMGEFLRLIRGESFHSARPVGTAQFQGEIYKMEDDIEKKLQGLRNKIAPFDTKADFYRNSMKKAFDL